jgi:hypothetical protein
MLAQIVEFFNTTRPDVLGAIALGITMAVAITGVLVWGFLQLWLDRRQGQYAANIKWNLLQVSVPQDAIQTPKGMENFFATIIGAKSSATWKEKWIDGKFFAWFSFEIVSDGGQISYYIRVQSKYRDLVEAALYAQYPEAQIADAEDYTHNIPVDYPNDEYNLFGGEIKLKKEGFLPIKTWEHFEHQGEKDQRLKDPLLSILEIMGNMRPGEHYYLQVLIMPPAEQDWTKEGEKYINSLFGKEEKKKKKGMFGNAGWLIEGVLEQAVGFTAAEGESKEADPFQAFRVTPLEREQLDLVAKKISKTGWNAKLRYIYFGKHEVFRKGTISGMNKGIWNQFAYPGLNSFGLHGPSVPKDDYPWQEWQMPSKQRMLAKRFVSRSMSEGCSPYTLSVDELATIWHFPAADARTPVLTSVQAKRAEAPTELLTQDGDFEVLPNFGKEKSPTSSLPDAKPLAAPRPTAFQNGVESDKPQQVAALVQSATPPTSATPAPAPPVPQSEPKTEEHAATLEHEDAPRAGKPAPLPPGLRSMMQDENLDF